MPNGDVRGMRERHWVSGPPVIHDELSWPSYDLSLRPPFGAKGVPGHTLTADEDVHAKRVVNGWVTDPEVTDRFARYSSTDTDLGTIQTALTWGRWFDIVYDPPSVHVPQQLPLMRTASQRATIGLKVGQKDLPGYDCPSMVTVDAHVSIPRPRIVLEDLIEGEPGRVAVIGSIELILSGDCLSVTNSQRFRFLEQSTANHVDSDDNAFMFHPPDLLRATAVLMPYPSFIAEVSVSLFMVRRPYFGPYPPNGWASVDFLEPDAPVDLETAVSAPGAIRLTSLSVFVNPLDI